MNQFETLLETAFDFYNNKEYKNALDTINKIEYQFVDIEDKIAILELKASALSQLGRNDDAVVLYQELAELYENDNSDFYQNDLIRTLDILANFYLSKSDKKGLKYIDKLIANIEKSDISSVSKISMIMQSAINAGQFCEKQNNSYGAKKYYKKALDKAWFSKEKEHKYQQVQAHYQLGNIFYDDSKIHDAIQNYTKIINISKEFNLDLEPAFIAAVYNNLAIASKTEFLFTDAVNYFKKALKIYLDLAQENPEEYLPFVGMTYNSLGNTYVEKFDVRDEIDTYGVSSFSGFGILSANNINQSRQTLQQHLNKEEGVTYYHNALDIFKKLYEKHPEKYKHYIATLYHNLGIIYDELEQYDMAAGWYEKALKLRRELVDENSEFFAADKAITLMNLVTLYQNLFEKTGNNEKLSKAKSYFEEAGPIINSLSNDLPVFDSMKSEWAYFKDYFSKIDSKYIDILQFKIKRNELDKIIDETTDAEKKIIYQTELVENLQNLIHKYPDDEYLIKELKLLFTDLLWYYLRAGQIDQAVEVKKKFFELGDDMTKESAINFAHLDLCQNLTEQAQSAYLQIIENDHKTKKETVNTIKRDLQLLSIKGVNVPSSLMIELDKILYQNFRKK